MDRRVIVAGVVVLVALIWFLRGSSGVPVDAATVVRGPLSLRVTTNGSVEPVAEAEIRARLDGLILEIPEPGTDVSKGDVILRIDAGPVASELAKARSERLSALESLRSARAKLASEKERAATDARLFEEGAITRERHAESQAALREARSRVSFLEQEVPLRVDSLDLRIRELEEQQQGTTVTAPFDGSIYRTEARRGAMVHAGEPILWMADLENLRVRANIDQVDLGRVHEGQPVQITSNAFPGRTWKGTVSEVIPHVVVRQSRSISESLARVEPPTEGLVPGMSVDVEIVVDEVASALQVPAEAVFREGGEPYVYRIEGGRAERTPVTLGLETVTAVEVVKGLDEDDRVILGPVRDLSNGERVDPSLHDVASR